MVFLEDPTDPGLRAHLEQCAEQRAENDRQEANLYVELTKDACLIEASNACDKAPISSLDDKMRDHLRACAAWVPEISGVVWVNPANAAETPVDLPGTVQDAPWGPFSRLFQLERFHG